MRLPGKVIGFSLGKPKAIIAALLIATLILGAFLVQVHVDMRPDNLLATDEHVSAVHEQIKKEFGLHDVVVLGVVNKQHPDGVFTPETLKKVHALSTFAATLVDFKDPEQRVVSRDIVAPDNVDTILQAGPGQVRFERLMQKPPTNREEALKIRDAALAHPLLKGTMVSEDGKALAISLPITNKDYAYTVAKQLREKIKELEPANGEEFHITGLPVVEAFFGRDMLRQMAIFLAIALLIIFLLIYYFFHNLQLIIAPIILAVCTVIITMGLLIGTGHTLHLLSSLIPLFILPIAVIGSIPILAEFCASYHRFQDKQKTLLHVMDELFGFLFFASLTSAAGFASLAAATPILLVRDFGIFISVGILLAWLLTVTFIPAYIMLISDSNLAHFASKPVENSPFNRQLHWIGKIASSKPWLVIAVHIGLLLVGGVGIFMIQVNDNPVNWFSKNQEIRVADRVLKDHFGGIDAAYLILSGNAQEPTAAEAAELLKKEMEPLEVSVFKDAALSSIAQETAAAKTSTELLDTLTEAWNSELDKVLPEDEAVYNFWTAAIELLEKVRSRKEIFKRPDILRYLAELQAHLAQQGDVSKSQSISDVVKKIYQELHEGDPQRFTIPDTVDLVADTLLSFQNSHNPEALQHFVNRDYTKVNLWLQLRSNDSRNMERVIKDVEQYLTSHPPPVELKHEWAGQTYLNLAWPKRIFTGMLKPLCVSLLVICVLLAILFRSPVWGLLAMLPLFCTIVFMYGVLGLISKDCDMPVAVSSLLLPGLVGHFAIYFLQRARRTMVKTGDWAETMRSLLNEPARVILRNIMVIAVGFMPLLLASVMPYQMAGVFLASAMLCSGLVVLWLLTALLTVTKDWIFKREIRAFAQQAAS
ncbi:efflux RND transporter permease subunit [Candidatus Electronema sp. PJ]|uniref:efflux RND transporter permease subunit n=1 Tax=Candidatus Electronema sp. PJ TaxID=3401572 RepID=UPI003AA8A0FB